MARTAPSSFLFTANDRKRAWLTPSRICPALSGLGTEKGKILLRRRHYQKKRLQLHSRFMAKYPMRTVHT